MEIWKDVIGYEGFYQVSSEGRVRSLDRIDSNGRQRHGCILSLSKDDKDYTMARLWKDNECRSFKVHKLMQQAFLGNTDLTIDHIDTDKSNNSLTNLKAVSMYDNVHNPITEEHFKNRIMYGRVIVNVTTNKEYNNAKLAYEDTGVNRVHICECCRGIRKTAGGYKWKYRDVTQ